MCDLTTEWHDADLQPPNNWEWVLVVYEYEIGDMDDLVIYQHYGVSKYSPHFHEWETKFLERGNCGYFKVLRWHKLPNNKLESRRRVYDD